MDDSPMVPAPPSQKFAEGFAACEDVWLASVMELIKDHHGKANELVPDLIAIATLRIGSKRTQEELAQRGIKQ